MSTVHAAPVYSLSAHDAVKEWHSEARRALIALGIFSLTRRSSDVDARLCIFFNCRIEVLSSHSMIRWSIAVVSAGYSSATDLNRLATRLMIYRSCSPSSPAASRYWQRPVARSPILDVFG